MSHTFIQGHSMSMLKIYKPGEFHYMSLNDAVLPNIWGS